MTRPAPVMRVRAWAAVIGHARDIVNRSEIQMTAGGMRLFRREDVRKWLARRRAQQGERT